MDIYDLNDALRAIADQANSDVSDDEFDNLTHLVARILGIDY
jgi:hypothetical protein